MKKILNTIYYALLPFLGLCVYVWYLITKNQDLRQQLASAKAQEELKDANEKAKEGLENAKEVQKSFLARYNSFMERFGKR